MNKKIILYSINTEFVLCISILLFELFKKLDYYPIWLILKGNDNRFNGVSLDKLPGEVFVFKNELNSMNTKPELGFLKYINIFRVDEFVHQNPYNIANLLLEQLIKSKNHNVSLTYISDSIALDVNPRLRTLLVSNLYLNYRRFLHLFYWLPLVVSSPRKYSCNVTHYIALNRIESSDAKFTSFKEILNNAKNNKLLKAVFDYRFNDDYDIYFFTQPVLQQSSFSESTKSEYKKLLEFLSDHAQENKVRLLLKVHPGEDSSTYIKYKNDYCSIFYNNNLPAELLFSIITNKKIMSCFSAVSTLDFSGRNQHYWLNSIIKYNPKTSFENSNIVYLSSYNDLKQQFDEISTRKIV